MNRNQIDLLQNTGAHGILRRAIKITSYFIYVLLLINGLYGQENLPPVGPAKKAQIPAIREFTLANGLRVAVVEKSGVPLVTAYLLVKAGARDETENQAGLARITATMLTRGTTTRSAEQIADDIEFLGGSINSGAERLNSFVTVTVTSDKIASAMRIMSDVVLNPGFDEKELDLLKAQTLDELKFNLTQPGFLANYVASKAVFGEHPVGGTPESINAISRADTESFYRSVFRPDRSVLIFVGDISVALGRKLAEINFGRWRGESKAKIRDFQNGSNNHSVDNLNDAVLVIDMPDSGQAAVNYFKRIDGLKRNSGDYYTASVYNSVLGGGYSSRLNQEIRIKRGLSYGAGSGFAWRQESANFSARAQTKNESAAEVARLMADEINRLAVDKVANTELVPRKSVLIGSFARSLETNASLAGLLGDLYVFDIPASSLAEYMSGIDAITDADIQKFAHKIPSKGTFIIVGDYAKFRDALQSTFPDRTIRVIPAAKVDLSSPGLSR
ncbi:MAG: M16 family metallopeptidase [Pyrinomonadaceae bacterium]